MKKNAVATTLKVIAFLEAIGTIILAIDFAGKRGDIYEILTISVLVAGFITCTMFFGFAEIINLLQRSADTQEEILNQMKRGSKAPKDQATKGSLQDIEENLPQM